MTAPIVAIAVMLIVSGALVFEVRAWSKGTRMITGRQKTYRILAALMMDAVLLAVVIAPLVQKHTGPWFQIGYWGVTMIVAFLMIVVTMLDIRAGLENYRASRREAFRGSFSGEKSEE